MVHHPCGNGAAETTETADEEVRRRSIEDDRPGSLSSLQCYVSLSRRVRDRNADPADVLALLHVSECVLRLGCREDLYGPNWSCVSLDVVFQGGKNQAIYIFVSQVVLVDIYVNSMIDFGTYFLKRIGFFQS